MTKRNYGYKNSSSKSGEITVRITPKIAERLKNHGKSVNRNAVSLVNEWISERLDSEERKLFEQMSREELLDLCLQFLNREH